FLEAGIELRIVPIACLFYRSVEMRSVFGIGITRRKIRSSAEPLSVALLQVSKVGMDRGNHRVSRMEHQRHTCRKKIGAATEWYFRGKFFRQGSVNRGKIHAGLFKHGAFFQNARSAAPAALTRPCIFAERFAIEVFDRSSDSILQLLEVCLRLFPPSHGAIIYN